MILDNSVIEKFGLLINRFLQKIDSHVFDVSLLNFINEEAHGIENILEILIDVLSFDIKP